MCGPAALGVDRIVIEPALFEVATEIDGSLSISASLLVAHIHVDHAILWERAVQQ